MLFNNVFDIRGELVLSCKFNTFVNVVNNYSGALQGGHGIMGAVLIGICDVLYEHLRIDQLAYIVEFSPKHCKLFICSKFQSSVRSKFRHKVRVGVCTPGFLAKSFSKRMIIVTKPLIGSGCGHMEKQFKRMGNDLDSSYYNQRQTKKGYPYHRVEVHTAGASSSGKKPVDHH